MAEKQNMKRMKELIQILNQASKAYYDEDREIMSNFEYDKLYDELVDLEKETGITLSNSPTINVGYEVVSSLPKEKHPEPMLSLDKTKDVEVLADWLGDHAGILSWKMDGLTVVLTYENGSLTKAVTRGNGEVGEVITNNARAFQNIPNKISYQGKLVVRGEAVIGYEDFEAINAALPETDAKYKNPRNLCSGAVRQLDSSITAKRNVNFFAFFLVEPEDPELLKKLGNSFEERFIFLKEIGFDVVEYKKVNSGNEIAGAVAEFAEKLPENAFPSDGLVLDLDDVAYGKSLGTTAKFPRNAIAFKWKDEQQETVLREIEWSPSRTGLINPVAVFDPVELEGTVVKRASLHNVTYVKDMQLGIGDRIKVYKANMIIPQLSENLTKSGNSPIAESCPVCGEKTVIKNENGSETLHCPNPECPAKHIKEFDLFASRNAMNMDGLSEATMEKFMEEGFLHSLVDLFHLDQHKDQIIQMDGFGQKSYEKIQESVENARNNATLAGFLYGLGIPGIGAQNAKLIARYFKNDMESILAASKEELCEIEGLGEVLADGVISFVKDEKKIQEVRALLNEINFVQEENNAPQDLVGKIFVITGSLETYPNRDALKKEIEDRGGKCSGSVSSKTSYLINNDILSNSSKNKKAKSLGIPIITENDFKKL
ncbi:MAG: NAD-dependent DNA ligase LigA [Lachnospiraceae bacterium]|nr:NAD-dependent DNA ligase LigA [Lachnospiraceae bacterium]